MKKKIILIVAIILVLTAGGIFYWWWAGEKEKIDIKEIKRAERGVIATARAEDFILREIPDGEIIIENKREGLRFVVPPGWEAMIQELEPEVISLEELAGRIVLTSRGAGDLYTDFAPPELTPSRGCWIIIMVTQFAEIDMKRMRERIEELTKIPPEELQEAVEEDGYPYLLIKIDGYKGYRENFNLLPWTRSPEHLELLTPVRYDYYHATRRVLVNERVYDFYAFFATHDKEKCLKDFSILLESVSIKELDEK